MESTTLGGTVRALIQKLGVEPAAREGRIASVSETGSVMATVRSLAGDVERLGPVGGCNPIARSDGAGGIELRGPQRGDRIWVGADESGPGSLFCATWEPIDA